MSLRACIVLVVTSLALLVGAGIGSASSRPSCPPSVPVQTFTVLNQAKVREVVLKRIERVVTDQSLQLRAAWGTPCVRFTTKRGWRVVLAVGVPQHNPDGSTSYSLDSRHCGPLGRPEEGTCYNPTPVVYVQTARLDYRLWARAFTHEIVETLVDPMLDRRWKYGLLEICDPVGSWTYQLRGVSVSDFVLPSYYSGGPGPWDQAQVLAGAFTAP